MQIFLEIWSFSLRLNLDSIRFNPFLWQSEDGILRK